MDIIIKEEDLSLTQIILYATVSFGIVSLIGIALYVACSKRIKLNWFEKNLLEAASEVEELVQSHEALVITQHCLNADNISENSLKSINKGNNSPGSLNEEQIQWTSRPSCGTIQISSTEESPPITPLSPSDSNKSMTLSFGSGSIPIARSDKHMVLARSPIRQKVSSMHSKLDHTKIEPSLYKENETSNETFDDIRGNLHITISYDSIAGILTVRLIEAQDLQPQQFSGTADPYAKIRLLPDKKNIWQTKIHKRTLNPVFDEDFIFEERPSIVGKRTLEILLYDFDAYSRHVCIGGVKIPLANIDLSDKVDIWKSLGVCSEQDAKIDLGDLMISLSFLPSAERLTVVVIKARNLRVIDDTRNSSDPYVKVSLIHGGKKIKKRKTGVIRNTVCPIFNEALTFDVSKDILKTSLLEFLVLHDSLLGTNEILGRAVLGYASEVRTEDRIFYDQMFRSKTAIGQWTPLTEYKMT